MSKLRVSLCRKNGSDRDLNELPGIAILRPFRSGIQVRSPEIIGSWVRRRRAKVDEKLVARSAVCAPKFDIARASRWRAPPFSAGRRKRSLSRRLVALTGSENSEVFCCASPSIYFRRRFSRERCSAESKIQARGLMPQVHAFSHLRVVRLPGSFLCMGMPLAIEFCYSNCVILV